MAIQRTELHVYYIDSIIIFPIIQELSGVVKGPMLDTITIWEKWSILIDVVELMTCVAP